MLNFVYTLLLTLELRRAAVVPYNVYTSRMKERPRLPASLWSCGELQPAYIRHVHC